MEYTRLMISIANFEDNLALLVMPETLRIFFHDGLNLILIKKIVHINK